MKLRGLTTWSRGGIGILVRPLIFLVSVTIDIGVIRLVGS